jgi:hypothetical protein
MKSGFEGTRALEPCEQCRRDRLDGQARKVEGTMVVEYLA